MSNLPVPSKSNSTPVSHPRRTSPHPKTTLSLADSNCSPKASSSCALSTYQASVDSASNTNQLIE